MGESLILIGGGGHCKSVLDSIAPGRYERILIADRPDKLGQQVNGIPISVTDGQLEALFLKGVRSAFITVGGIGAADVRETLYRQLKSIGFLLPNLCDPTAAVSRHARLAEGVFIGKQAVVNAGAQLGACCIVNSGAVIEHDCRLSAFVHAAPGAVLAGNVRVGKGAHIGAGACLLQGTAVGEYTVVGMGSVVLHDLPAHCTAYGNPCREVMKNA